MLWRVELNAPERKRSWSVTHRNEFLHTHAVFPTYMQLYTHTHTHTLATFSNTNSHSFSLHLVHTHTVSVHGGSGAVMIFRL